MIEVSGLTRCYGSHKAIDGLSFRIGSNEIVGFLGLNGAGKSTTLRILGGILLPTAGSVKIHGQDLLDAPLEARRRIGFLPEVPPLYKEMTVRDFLFYIGSLREVPSDRIEARIQDVARRCSIDRVLDQVIGTLSWGFQKRVGIAQAIIHEPALVILDEPIAGLDPVQIVEMRKVIVGLRERCTVLVSSHILSEISQTCDRILVLHKGRLVAEGTEDSLTSRIEPSKRIVVFLRGTAAGFEAAVKGMKEVVSWKVHEDHGAILAVRVELTGDHREELVRRLVQGGLGIRRLEDAEAELEQVFVYLTREEKA